MNELSVVYKYPIKMKNNKLIITVPKNSIIISAVNIDFVSATGFIYAIVDPEETAIEEKEIIWLGTGHRFGPEIKRKIVEEFKFLGTFKDERNNSLIWHIWVEQ